MKLTNFISFGAVIAMAVAPIAASQAQSSATSGDYMVVRDGHVVSVAAGSALLNGDRVVTRGSAGATIALAGCMLDVPAASTVVVDAKSCSGSVESLKVARAGYSADKGSSLHGAGWVVALLALAAAIAGGAIAGGAIAAGGKSHPTSP